MFRRADRRLGMTMMELMISVAVSSLILISVAAVFVTVARAMTVVTDQTRRQSEAGLALDRMAEILRNAVYPVTIADSDDVRFIDVRNPGATARIWLEDGSVMYDPDMSAADDERELAAPVSGLTIGPDPNPLIGASALQLQISYNYMSFRDYHPDQSHNATFVTSVFMRNAG